MTILTVAERLGRARLLMFDLDGTLVDSSPIHARAYRETFGPLGINIDYAAIAGLTTADAVDKLVSEHHLHFGPAQRDELRSTKQRLALEFIRADLEALPGAVEFVREARARGRFALALCTSASPGSAAAALAKIKLEDVFDPIVTSADVRSGKPAPDLFEFALKRHGVGPLDALIFEDSLSGLEAAKAAGVPAIKIGPEGHQWQHFLDIIRILP